MATFVSLGYPAFCDGMEWTSLLSRQLEGGVATWDSNASATAVNPLGGVFGGAGNPLQVTQSVTPALSVLVNAGYVAVPHPTAGHGVYLFGLQDQSTLTIASNGAASSRLDLIVARVYDTANSSSYCDIEVVEGTAGDGQPATPPAAVLLAVVTVAHSATSVTNSNITDERTFTVAAGGILPSTTGAAPPLAAGQVLWNTSLGLLQRLAAPVTYTQTWSVNGTYTFTYPDDVYAISGQGWGAGGPGGGTDGSTNVGSGGGGGGEWAADTLTATPGTELTIVVGAGGAGAAAGTDTVAAGGTTTVTGADVTLTANGGQPGQDATYPAPGGLGGTGSTNAEHNDGGAGGTGDTEINSGGGGGGSGGPGSAGQDGGDGGQSGNGNGGYGAPAVPDGGPGGQGGDYDGNGYAPSTGPGGGGGGTSGTGNSSGAGDDGQVTLTWTVQPTALTPVFATDSAEEDLAVVNTSNGATGLTTGGTSAYGWGIGGGTNDGSFDGDNYVAPEIQVTFDADGATDFQFDAKWGMAVPEAAAESSSPSISKGQCRIILQLDGTTLDQVCLRCSAAGGVTSPGDGGSWTYYTSSQRGDTPSSGTHTLTLAIETEHTQSGYLSGVHIGDLASVGTSPYPFGGSALPSYFTEALTAENCSLRVAGITAASI